MKYLKPKIAMFVVIFLSAAFTLHAQIITTVAGNGIRGYSGDGGLADSASLCMGLTGVAVDKNNNLYIADAYNNRIRKVTPDGIINTIAGNGIAGYNGDGCDAISASLNNPFAVLPDSLGNLYIADNVNSCVRKISVNGTISTIAGIPGQDGYSGDSGLATMAKLSSPWALAMDNEGNLYVSDAYNYVVRKVDKKGIITTVAGNGNAGLCGDGGLAIAASLNKPAGIAFDKTNNLYIADYLNNCIRKVTPDGIISTVAGIYVSSDSEFSDYGYSGDGGLATSAKLSGPFGIAIDKVGNLFIADGGNSRIRKVDLNGIITTFAGTGTDGFSGDGGVAHLANLKNSCSIAIDEKGNIFIVDAYNFRIRKVTTATF